jgi:hypothetical protein
MSTTKHQHDHVNALGGFWIKADGSSIPVEHECHHYETVVRAGLAGYNAAYERGWVRISFCSEGPVLCQLR